MNGIKIQAGDPTPTKLREIVSPCSARSDVDFVLEWSYSKYCGRLNPGWRWHSSSPRRAVIPPENVASRNVALLHFCRLNPVTSCQTPRGINLILFGILWNNTHTEPIPMPIWTLDVFPFSLSLIHSLLFFLFYPLSLSPNMNKDAGLRATAEVALICYLPYELSRRKEKLERWEER